jgi:AmmeMemoRadiSam system protein A
MPSPDSRAPLAASERRVLLAVARASIEHGLTTGSPLRPDPRGHGPTLQRLAASFVSLHRGGELRGCVGRLEPVGALVVDVAENAYGAAFLDERFAPLGRVELADLRLGVSVLGELQPLPVGSRAELCAALRPKLDGLVLRQGRQRATFLPGVWETLREPEAFVAALERKAGLDRSAWERGVECLRYDVEEFAE